MAEKELGTNKIKNARKTINVSMEMYKELYAAKVVGEYKTLEDVIRSFMNAKQ